MTFLTKSEIWKRQTVQYISKVMNATHFIRIVAIMFNEAFMSWMRTVAFIHTKSYCVHNETVPGESQVLVSDARHS